MTLLIIRLVCLAAVSYGQLDLNSTPFFITVETGYEIYFLYKEVRISNPNSNDLYSHIDAYMN